MTTRWPHSYGLENWFKGHQGLKHNKMIFSSSVIRYLYALGTFFLNFGK